MPYTREKIVLSNGLRVLLDERASSESVGITCLVAAGSQLDFPGKDGLAHVVEHLLFRTKWSRKERSLFKAIEDTGGGVEACTRVDRTAFSVYAHRDDAAEAVRILSKVVCDLPTDKDSLKLEKKVVAEELQATGEDGPDALQRNKYALLGGDETLRHSVGGTRKKVRGITLQDVKDFYDRYYVADNMVLSVVGNFNREEVVSQIGLLFNSIPAATPSMNEHCLEASGPKLKVGGSFLNFMAVFFRCPSFRAKELAAVELINDILSTGSHSVLFQSLREQHALVYWIGGALDLSTDYGSLDIMTSTRASNVPRVLTGIIDEISKLCSSSISEDDLNLVRKRLLKRQILKFEDVCEASKWYAERELLSSRENADDFEQWIKEVQSVSAQDLKETAQKLFVPENCFVYVLGHVWPWHRRSVLRHIARMGSQSK
jgi:predicted Zn-dependent peptidase